MASKLIIDRIPPDMHVDEEGNIVWTPRLIDFNSAAYSRGHIVTSDEFNTELIKQTYQGNYNTDTISVLIGLYNDLKTDVTNIANSANNNTAEALLKADIAEANSIEALGIANNAFTTSTEALSDAQTAINTANEALENVTEGLGTQVTVGGQLVKTFNADSKLDATANAVSATKATQDADGNVISSTYVKTVLGKGLSSNDFTTTLLNKLNGIAEGANKTIIDTALSTTSTNPVQNKIIKSALDGKLSTTGNAVSATKATQDQYGLNIDTAYVRTYSSRGALSENGGSLNDLYKDSQDIRYVCTYLGLANKWTDKPEASTAGFVVETFPMRRSSTPYRTYMQKYSSRGGIWFRTATQETSADAPSWTNWEKVITNTSATFNANVIIDNNNAWEHLQIIASNDAYRSISGNQNVIRFDIHNAGTDFNNRRYLDICSKAYESDSDKSVYIRECTNGTYALPIYLATQDWVQKLFKNAPTSLYSGTPDINKSQNLSKSLSSYTFIVVDIARSGHHQLQAFPSGIINTLSSIKLLFADNNSYADVTITNSTITTSSSQFGTLDLAVYAW